MNNKPLAYLCAIFFFLTANAAKGQQQPFPPEPLKWNPNELGTQRAVIKVRDNSKLIQATIPWRNRWMDARQEIILVDSATQKTFTPSAYLWINPVSGAFSFKPLSGKGIYYVYYRPYQQEGRTNYPNASFRLRAQAAPTSGKPAAYPHATFLRIESVDSFNANGPMEKIASPQEVAALIKRRGAESYLLFPEKATNSIRMADYLPEHWTKASFDNTQLHAEGEAGSYLAFQLGVYPLKGALHNVQVRASDLRNSAGGSIDATNFDCLNTQGTSYTGQRMKLNVVIAQRTVQAMWCGFKIPRDAKPGIYRGTATVTANNMPARTVKLSFAISAAKSTNHGVNEPWKMTRLPWLNSTLAHANTVIAPYTPVNVSNDSVLNILGRQITLGPSGFPSQINTFFSPEVTTIGNNANSLLREPMRLSAITAAGQALSFKEQNFKITAREEGKVSWHAQHLGKEMLVDVEGSLEFDGYMHYTVAVKALKDINLRDISMYIPMATENAKYFMGLGRKGGKRPQQLQWQWDVAHKNQDGAWIGNVNAGLQFSLRDEHYERPLNTNFYLQKPLVLPSSWGNGNRGGIRINDEKETTLIQCYSGERKMQKEEVLYFNFTLLITPFHTLNTDAQWKERYYHAYKPVDSVKSSGANVINIHHANRLNPYINYPFIATREMKGYIDSAHKAGLKVKIYNTVREVSNRVYELYPLRSLGTEVFSAGPGRGSAWLQEHVGRNYIAAWYVPFYQDAAIINSGMNRWHNYYVEGMNWLVDNIGIDGIYLDDVAFDRITMKRIKRILTKNGHPGLIDLHSANQYNERDGFNNSANLYLEHFPYINRLWFGEYFDYEKNDPDFFLTEVSGIPFGLMGEMLQDGGNPWRGMIYGMTNRLPYQKTGPRGLWKVWDDFGIEGSKMLGYWSPDIPVKTTRDDVLSTVYSKAGKAMIALASWASADTEIRLDIDWKKLGMDPAKVTIRAPFIADYQEERSFEVSSTIPVKKNQGWLLLIDQK